MTDATTPPRPRACATNPFAAPAARRAAPTSAAPVATRVDANTVRRPRPLDPAADRRRAHELSAMVAAAIAAGHPVRRVVAAADNPEPVERGATGRTAARARGNGKSRGARARTRRATLC